MIVRTEEVMGTVVSLHVVAPRLPALQVDVALAAACAVLHRADEVFSTWKPDSAMNRVRSGRLALEDAPEEIGVVLAICEEARGLSGGWFDPWAMPGGLDPTGLVKGWAVERALGTLRGAFAEAALVNAGGDVGGYGHPPGAEGWRVGIRHPWRPEGLAGIVKLEGAVATSGTYERGPHLIDPHDGLPRTAAASATVVGPSLAIADALATALAVGGDNVLGQIAALGAYGAYLIRADGSEETAGPIRFLTD